MKLSNKTRSDQALYSLLENILHEREIRKLDKLMDAREDDSLAKVIRNLIKVIPNSVKTRHCIPDTVIRRLSSVECEDKLYIKLCLNEGVELRTFHSRQQYRNYYYCFRDRLPSMITPESYQAVHDITFRLDAGRDRIDFLIGHGLFIPSDTASIFECGAYNAWKAIGLSRHLGNQGKILVVEIDDEQFKLAELNMQSNLPQESFEVLQTGIWHCEEERSYSFEHHASHSLNTPDEHSHHSHAKTIRTNTLDNIIDNSNVDVFDFLNIQTGGSEYESIQGLSRNVNRVKVMWVGSHYVHQGVTVRWKSMKDLLEKGCRIYFESVNRQPPHELKEIRKLSDINETDTGGFFAVSPQYSKTLVPVNLKQ